MKVILYAATRDGIASELEVLIASRVPKQELEVYNSIKGLSNRLVYRSHDVDTVILAASGTADLIALISIVDLMEDTKIILILPNSQPQNISLAHSLYPRFIGYADGKLDDIAAVIDNMFGATVNPGHKSNHLKPEEI